MSSSSSSLFQSKPENPNYLLTSEERQLLSEELEILIKKIIEKKLTGLYPNILSHLTVYIVAKKDFVLQEIPHIIEAALQYFSDYKKIIMVHKITTDNIDEFSEQLSYLGNHSSQIMIHTLVQMGFPLAIADALHDVCTDNDLDGPSENLPVAWVEANTVKLHNPG